MSLSKMEVSSLLLSLMLAATCAPSAASVRGGGGEPRFECSYQEGRGVDVVATGDSAPCSECYGIATVYETEGDASRKVSALLTPFDGAIRGTVYAPGLGPSFDLWVCLYPSGECYRVDVALSPPELV